MPFRARNIEEIVVEQYVDDVRVSEIFGGQTKSTILVV